MSVVVLRHFHVVFDVDVLDLNLSNKVDRAFEGTENDAHESNILKLLFLASLLNSIIH